MKRGYLYLGLVLIMLLLILVRVSSNSKLDVANYESRKTMEMAMDFVRTEKPTPPVGAIFYAKVAENIYNGTTTDFRKTLDEVLLAEKNLPNVYVKPGNKWNGYWVKETATSPFSPKISQYPRFNLKDFDYQVPEPPTYMSEEYKQELQKVIDAAQNRTLEQGAIVNFYGGVPGTEQPAGIWQNIYFDYVKNYNQNIWSKILGKQITDAEYAHKQMVLAQVLADAFMECWKVKYVYQTKRPSMAAEILSKKINLAMPNPPFGSYVSGHSTISFAAATVLAGMFPENADKFLKQAEDAKNSRLWAGIHFNYDNVEGKKFGKAIGEYYNKNVVK
jgi:hypothetical protein